MQVEEEEEEDPNSEEAVPEPEIEIEPAQQDEDVYRSEFSPGNEFYSSVVMYDDLIPIKNLTLDAEHTYSLKY